MRAKVTSSTLAVLVLSACSEVPTGTLNPGPPALGVGTAHIAFVETFDGIPLETECDGLVSNGVRYAFSVGAAPSADCQVGPVGPGATNNITPPLMEGDAGGVLDVAFDVPTSAFGFGVALSTLDSPLPESVIVELYRPGAGLLRAEVRLDTESDPLFAGGRFDYAGPAVASASIQFDAPAARFVLDDLTYFRPRGKSK